MAFSVGKLVSHAQKNVFRDLSHKDLEIIWNKCKYKAKNTC